MRCLLTALCLLVALPVLADGVGRLGLPAERARGLVWMQDFGSQAECERDGATVTGSPTFSRQTGVALDGANDYLTYDIVPSTFDSENISIVIEFTPDFAYDEDGVRYLFDASEAGNTDLRFSLAKGANAGGNTLGMEWADTFPTPIPSATYGQYWLVNQRNVLVMSMTSGDNNVYLNGHSVMNSNAQAWTPKAPLVLKVGAKFDDINRFDGTIHSIRIFHAKLTAQEAADYTDNTTFDYMNKATAHWQFRLQDHDPSNVRTLDVSGEIPLTFGDGSTSTTYPTKTTEHGYYFDGGDYLDAGDPTILQITDDSISFGVMVNPKDLANRGYIAKRDGSNRMDILEKFGTEEFQCQVSTSGGLVNADSGIIPQVGTWYHVMCVYDGATLKAYVNGVERASSNQTGNIAAISANWMVGVGNSTGPSQPCKGAISEAYIWDDPLTAIQVMDLAIRARQQVNQK